MQVQIAELRPLGKADFRAAFFLRSAQRRRAGKRDPMIARSEGTTDAVIAKRKGGRPNRENPWSRDQGL